MHKRILIYLYFYHPYANANTNVVLPLINALKEHYDVTVFTIDAAGNQPPQETHNGFRILRDTRKRGFSHFIHQVYGSSPCSVGGHCRWLKRLILRVFHRIISKERLEQILPDMMSCVYLRVLRQGSYDALITVSAPFITQSETLALARDGELRRLEVKWFPYLSDPHATFVGHADQYRDLIGPEIEMFSLADAVFTSPELYEDNKNTLLGRFTEKTIPIQFANLRPLKNAVPISYLEKDKINCVYVGSLFDIRVRNPEYFYRLAQQCDKDFHFHIICYEADQANKRLRQQYVNASPRIFWHERASLAECHSLMCQADILINLGNRCTNQTPSKVFDYIATGKPIVNFCSLEGDTAKHYLERYPAKLNLQEKKILDQADVAAFEAFCRGHIGQILPFSKIEDLYPDCITRNVTAKFVRQIDKLLE